MGDRMREDDKYSYYLQYYTEQKGSGLGHYSGRNYVPIVQDGDGLGEIFASAKPALINFAKNAGRRVLGAGASVLRDVLQGKNAGESAKKAFSEAGVSLLDDTIGGRGGASSTSTKRSGRVSKGKRRAKRQKNIFKQ